VTPHENRRTSADRPEGVKQRLAGVTRAQKAFAVLFLLLLVAMPVGLTLARGDRYESRIPMFEVDRNREAQRFPIPPNLEAYVSRLAIAERVTTTAPRLVDFPIDRSDVAASTRVAPGRSPRSVFLIATGTTPERAERLANVVARLMVDESRHEVEARVRGTLQELLGRGTDPELSRAEQGSIRRRIDELVDVLRGLSTPLAVGDMRASTPAVTAPVDKLVQRLPGESPPSPSPVWVGLAGLLLAVALLVLWLLLPQAVLRARSRPG
jgi:hypothetical protein